MEQDTVTIPRIPTVQSSAPHDSQSHQCLLSTPPTCGCEGGELQGVLSYVVFILKLILSYLPVHLTLAQAPTTPTLIYNIFPTHHWEEMLVACSVCLAATPCRHRLTHPFSLNSSTSARSERGEDGREYVRCTGRYDNISFKIKTTY